MIEANSIFLDQCLVEVGDHLVLLYEEEKEVVETIVSYIKARLLKNEKCIYIAGDVETQHIIDALNEENMYEPYLKKGQLFFVEKEDCYLKEGIFTPKKIIELLISHIKNAISEGFSGIAVTGELSFLIGYEKGIERIIEYEWMLNEFVFDKYPISAICRYNMKKFSNESLVDIIQLHPLLIYNGHIYENPFYIPAVGYKKKEIAKHQVRIWLDNVSKFSNTKSRFYKEIKTKEQENQELRLKLTDEIIISMTGLLGIHDSYTKDHSENVANISRKIAEELNFSKKDITKIYYAGLVHDIGKTIISKEILNKNGALTDDEYDIIKKHPRWGYETLSKSSELLEIAQYVLYHHERWDGFGYPDGLAEEKIPIASRILTVADAYDAMTNDRPYRKALSKEVAVGEIKRNSGLQFDPEIVNIFLKLF